MKKNSGIALGIAVLVALGFGYLGGSLLSASASEQAAAERAIQSTSSERGAELSSPYEGPRSVPINRKPVAPLDPFTRLRNGETVGNWRMDTPLAERPDFVQISLGDGKHGYLRLIDTIEGQVVSGDDDAADMRTIQDKVVWNLAAVGVVPNSAGELWAPVYAEDGTKVIGKHMVVSGLSQ